MVNLEEPPFLAVGTEVSAKYKGAFCEAKIKKVTKIVKCKVLYSNGTLSFVSDDAIKGSLKVGAVVYVKCSDKKELVRATIQKVQDCSQYTVVFNDGDITCLKRTALCLKSGKHFAASATLDQLPLTHPEHIGAIIYTSGQRNRKLKKPVVNTVTDEVTEMDDIGKVICVESNDKKKIRDNWFPGLIVTPKAQSSVKTNITEDYLVRSFKDGKYYTVPKKEITEFTKEIAAKVENPTLKTAVEKALFYLDKDELPPHWDRDLLFGLDKNCITTDSEGMYDSDNSDEESIEEKDHFVAQLFKFMDDRGTPLNQAPVINNKDVDLYKLFKVVNTFGGFNKVNKFKQWKFVSTKIGHEHSIFCVKQAYQQYLHSFEDFYRKLGCTMLSNPRNIKSRSRFSRNIIRDIDKALPNSSYTSTEKNKQSLKQESNDKKDKTETVNNDNVKDSGIVKKTTKTDDKNSCKNNEESSKKSEKKKNTNSNSSLRNRTSVKSDAKTKKELKETKIEDNIVDKLCVDENSTDKKVEKKKYARNLFGKSMKKPTKKEKIVKVKSTETGLPSARKKRSIKDQIKTFVKVITPFKKSKRGASNIQLETLTKIKPDDDIPKLTRSKSKDDFPNKIRKVSVINEPTDNLSMIQTVIIGSILESQNKIKKSDDSSDKKKTVKKKKEDSVEKVVEHEIGTPVANETEILEKDSPVGVGDNLVVYYGDKHATTYDAKVLNICDIKGQKKFYVHYKGWNSRYDEWIDFSRIALKSKGPEIDNDADSSKSEQKNSDPKKTPSNNRARRSVTPSMSYQHRKKSPFSSARPTRTCTLSDRPLSSIGKYTVRDNSDSESEYSGNLGLAKQYNKKSQPTLKALKSEHDTAVKTDILDADNQKKALYPKTYPSKELLMQRNLPKKAKSCMFKVHSTKTAETEICEKVTLQTPIDSKVTPPSDLDNEKIKVENKCDDEIFQNEQKIPTIHYLSPKEKFEKHNQLLNSISECSTTLNQKIENNVESLTFEIKSKNVVSDFCPSSSSEDEEPVPLQTTPKANENPSTSNNKVDNSKISRTDFDLNKLRSEMKGLIRTSTINIDAIHNPKSFVPDQPVEIKIPNTIDPVLEKEDVYEFKESEPCDFETIPSVIDEKHRRVMKHIDSPTSYNFEKTFEVPKTNEPVSQEILQTESVLQEIVKENESITLFESNSNNAFDNSIQIEIKQHVCEDKLGIQNEKNIKSPIQSGNEPDESNNFQISDTLSSISLNYANKTKQEFRNEIGPVDESDSKEQVLNLCMKSPESPSNNIFSMSETNDTNIVEFDDYEDDDESKLIIAENDKIETDYQIDSDSLIVDKKNDSSNGQTGSKPIQSFPQSIHQSPNTNSDCRSSYQINRVTPFSKLTDDESTTSCNESIPNEPNFDIYSHFESQITNKKVYQSYDDNDTNFQSRFEFESDSKSPTKNTENESSIKLYSTEVANNERKMCEYENKKSKDKSEKISSTILPELQCREEIVDEDTLNNTIGGVYEVYKPSTSKGFFDLINQQTSNKDSFYQTSVSNDTKKSFFESEEGSRIRHVIYGTSVSGTSKSDAFEDNNKSIFYDNVSSTNKNKFYDNPMPSTSKRISSPSETDVNNVLFCEETIPGSPNGGSEEQFDQEERKKPISHALYEERDTVSTIYSVNRSFRKSLITTMDSAENKTEEYTNTLQNDGTHNQRQLQFLAEISSQNLDVNASKENEPSNLEEPIAEQIIDLPENSPTKRKIVSTSHGAQLTKRSKTTSVTIPSTTDDIQKPTEIKIDIPSKDGKPLVTFTPDMTSAQRQALILSKINDLRKEYILIKARAAIVDRRRKKIRKRKREMAKIATLNQNKQSLTANSTK